MRRYNILWILFFLTNYANGQIDPSISPQFLAKQAEIQKCYYNLEKYSEGLEISNELLKIAKNDLEKGMALYEKVMIILHSSSDYEAGEPALPFALESAKILAKAGDREYFHRALNLIANCYLKRYYNGPGDPIWAKSEKYTILALRVQTDSTFVPDITYEDTFDDEYASKGVIENSIKYTKENLKIWEKKNSEPHMMWRNQTLGKLYFNLNGDFTNAEKYLLKARQFALSIGDFGFEHTILNQLTAFALESKNYDKCIYYGKINLEKAIATKNEIREGSITDLLYSAYWAIGKKEEAFKHKQRSFDINEKYYRQTEYERTKLFKDRNDVLQKQSELQKELRDQNNVKWALSIAIGLLILGLMGLVYYNRQLKYKNDSISKAMLEGQTIERKRVAMDLHDNLGSTLSALWMSLDTVDQNKMSIKEQEIHLNLKENLEKAYNDVRLLSHNLLPDEFEKQGLIPAIQSLTENLNRNSKMQFLLKVSNDFGRISNKIEFELYSISLELVNNILKHSNASEAHLELERINKEIKLIIKDNGTGKLNLQSDGKGMKNVKSRVASLQGEWKIIEATPNGLIHEIIVFLPPK